MATNSIKNISVNPLQQITWKALRKATLSLAVPFELELPQGEPPIVCEEIVRLVPGTRMVAFGTWRNKPVVAKLFYEGHHVKRHLHREIAGIDILTSSGTLMPTVLYQGSAKTKRIQVLIFERILNAVNVEDIWQQQKHTPETLSLLKKLTLEIAAQHVAGVVQHDLHLKNFLVAKGKIYTLDGGQIEAFGEPLPKKNSLQNLSLFLSQLGAGVEEIQRALFDVYTQSRGWLVRKADIRYLNACMKKWNASRWQAYDKKIMRNCSAFLRKRTLCHEMLIDRQYATPAFLALVKQPEMIFRDPSTRILKAGRSSTVAQFMCDGKTFVVKRYNIKNMFHALRRCLRSTRAMCSWRFAHLLRLFGVSIVKPIAVNETRFLGLRGKSYFISECYEGVDAGNFFENKNNRAQFHEQAQAIAALFKSLLQLNITHGDLKQSNILMTNTGPVLLDLDGTMQHASRRKAARLFRHELQRFMRNWTHDTEITSLFAEML